MRIALLLIMTLLTLGSLGCQGDPAPVDVAPDTTAEIPTPSNAVCPIMGGPVKASPKTATVIWQGQTIGFCCPPCQPDWEKLTDQERADRLAAATERAAAIETTTE